MRRFRELLDRRRGRFDAVFGMQEQHRPALAALDQIDARAFDSERVGYGVGPLQHFLTDAFDLVLPRQKRFTIARGSSQETKK